MTEHRCKECKYFNTIPSDDPDDTFCWSWMIDVKGNDTACERFEDDKEEVIIVVMLVLFFFFLCILTGISGI